MRGKHSRMETLLEAVKKNVEAVLPLGSIENDGMGLLRLSTMTPNR